MQQKCDLCYIFVLLTGGDSQAGIRPSTRPVRRNRLTSLGVLSSRAMADN